MKKSILCLLFLVSLLGIAQDPQIELQRTIGGASYDEMTDFKMTNDGNFIVIGQSTADISGDKTDYQRIMSLWT